MRVGTGIVGQGEVEAEYAGCEGRVKAGLSVLVWRDGSFCIGLIAVSCVRTFLAHACWVV